MPKYKAPEPKAWYAVLCVQPRRRRIGGGPMWPEQRSFCNLGMEYGSTDTMTTDRDWALDVMRRLARRNPNCKYHLMVAGPATVTPEEEVA